MKRIVEFPTADGSSVLVEVDEPASTPGPGTLGGFGKSSELVERAQQTFEAAVERARPAAEQIIHLLHGLSTPPDEITVEFGLKLSAVAGAIVASASAPASTQTPRLVSRTFSI